MTWNQLTGQEKFKKWKDWTPGDSVAGKIIRFQPNDLNKSRTDVVIEVIEQKFKTVGEYPVNVGDTFKINAATSLESAIEKGLKVGHEIKVIYKGQYIVKKGKWAGSKGHDLEVFSRESSSEEMKRADEVL